MSDTLGTTRNKFFGPFLWAATGTGCLAFLYALWRLPSVQVDWRFFLLVAMMLLLAARNTVPIPRLSSQISVSDTFVFLLLLIYGAPAAIMNAVVNALAPLGVTDLAMPATPGRVWRAIAEHAHA